LIKQTNSYFEDSILKTNSAP